MSALVYLILVVMGLILGSFVNALVWRLHAQEQLRHARSEQSNKARLANLSISKGRSRCFSCNHQLSAKDLVPVFSWLMLRGRCRYCGNKFPDSPLAELAVPSLFVVSYIFWPFSLIFPLEMVAFGIWLSCLVIFIALAIYDIKWFLLPDRLVFPLIGISLVYRIVLSTGVNSEWLGVLLGGLWGLVVLAGLFYGLFVVSEGRWIGGGDVKLALALGLLAGGPMAALLLLFVASIAGTLASLPMIAKGQELKGAKIPFGPFLLFATVVTVLFSEAIFNWYASLLAIT